MLDNMGRTIYEGRTLRIAKPDGKTYDALGRYICDTDESQRKDHDRETLCWTLEKGRRERALNSKPEHYQAQHTQELGKRLTDEH